MYQDIVTERLLKSSYNYNKVQEFYGQQRRGNIEQPTTLSNLSSQYTSAKQRRQQIVESYRKIYNKDPIPKYHLAPETLPNAYSNIMNHAIPSSIYGDFRLLADGLFNGDMFRRFGGARTVSDLVDTDQSRFDVDMSEASDSVSNYGSSDASSTHSYQRSQYIQQQPSHSSQTAWLEAIKGKFNSSASQSDQEVLQQLASSVIPKYLQGNLTVGGKSMTIQQFLDQESGGQPLGGQQNTQMSKSTPNPMMAMTQMFERKKVYAPISETLAKKQQLKDKLSSTPGQDNPYYDVVDKIYDLKLQHLDGDNDPAIIIEIAHLTQQLLQKYVGLQEFHKQAVDDNNMIAQQKAAPQIFNIIKAIDSIKDLMQDSYKESGPLRWFGYNLIEGIDSTIDNQKLSPTFFKLTELETVGSQFEKSQSQQTPGGPTTSQQTPGGSSQQLGLDLMRQAAPSTLAGEIGKDLSSIASQSLGKSQGSSIPSMFKSAKSNLDIEEEEKVPLDKDMGPAQNTYAPNPKYSTSGMTAAQTGQTPVPPSKQSNLMDTSQMSNPFTTQQAYVPGHIPAGMNSYTLDIPGVTPGQTPTPDQTPQ